MRKFAFLCCAALSACSSPTSSTDQILPWLQGAWEYSAVQTSPALRMNGVLTITQQDDNLISGALEYVETDNHGNSRIRLHMFTGRIRGGRHIDMDAFVASEKRRHVGTIAGDSIGGSFVQPTASGDSLNGSFVARRR